MSPYGPYLRNLRRFATSEIFSSARIQMTSIIRTDGNPVFGEKIVCRRKSRSGGEFIVLYVDLYIMMRMVYGERYFEGHELESEKGRAKFNDVNLIFGSPSGPCVADFFPFLKFVSSLIGNVKFKRLLKKRDVFLQNLIDTHRRKKRSCSTTEEGDEKRKNIIEVMLLLQESEPELYTDDIIKAIIKVMLVGGTETSITTLEAAVSFLIHIQMNSTKQGMRLISMLDNLD
ncbi:hypothetical protein Vadar_032931 [Vaccinium darrowii]|uniref:Uncharacterized protein n=1 Tax=Vaccinium darrowii TaxID=229202 RepID=A0ACB7Y4Q1_9ERIC|nr:hypothetical protein Vadar_032931 [Vaccinium darrowii]